MPRSRSKTSTITSKATTRTTRLWLTSSRRPSANKKQVITKRRCGRGPGGKGKAKYRCADGSKTSVNEEMMKVDIIYLRNIIRQELTKLLGSQAKRRACSLADLVKAQDLWARSEKGEAFATKAKS